ncbi:MAG: retroviral-like aspartic protease family protein [Candidatus Delongbacteria bacterium]|nr:retroviral-like aspartic protease family protein [Candidatus Delongbacteria bacterium]MBN2835159.1 retroviral-like aspartic protease family protein [Candidatus Delongbacteria bacterium]
MKKIYSIILIFVLSLSSDTIFLKNGRKFEGIELERDSLKIKFQINIGSTTVNIDDIDSISKSNDNNLINKWNKSNFLDNYPKKFKYLRDEYFQLQKIKDQYDKDVSDFNQIVTRKKTLEREIENSVYDVEKLKKQYETAEYFQRLNIDKKLNDLYKKINLHQNELSRIEFVINKTFISDASYIDKLMSLDFKITALSENDRQIQFIKLLSDQIDKLMENVSISEIKCEIKNNQVLVNVSVNGIMMKFIVDTGASQVVISEKAAIKAGVKKEKGSSVRISLADGSTADAFLVNLDEVTLGTASEQNVTGIITKNSPGSGIDGLLGYSYLGRFHVNIDNYKKIIRLSKVR